MVSINNGHIIETRSIKHNIQIKSLNDGNNIKILQSLNNEIWDELYSYTLDNGQSVTILKEIPTFYFKIDIENSGVSNPTAELHYRGAI